MGVRKEGGFHEEGFLKEWHEAAKKTAKASVNSASFFSMYQPKEPDVLKKKETK
ncbi:MAG: cyclic lactone autoinducer peptide [Lachnospira eligens]